MKNSADCYTILFSTGKYSKVVRMWFCRKSALLTVVSVTILGPDQNSAANCLLDCGAQINLVRHSTADRGHESEKETNNDQHTHDITRVSVDVEEVQIKLYKG